MKKVLFLMLIFSFVACAKEKTLKPISHSSKISVKEVGNFDGIIWGMDFFSDSELILSLRKGELYLFNLMTKKKLKLKAPKNIFVSGQGGLLDVKIYKKFIYLTYAEQIGPKVHTTLARSSLKSLKSLKFEVLFRTHTRSINIWHYGSRLSFVDDHIYMTVGDRGLRHDAQSLKYHNGKILKLTLDGKPAANNPFIKRKDALAEIWSYGHRNPQGITYSKKFHRIYAAEFGPKGGDELNIINKAKNYGWPIITYGKEYTGFKINNGKTKQLGLEQPLTYWTPSISPSGIIIYENPKKPGWDNNIFIANLSSEHLRRIVLNEDGSKVLKQEKLLENLEERLRNVNQGPNGSLFVSTDSGKLLKINLK